MITLTEAEHTELLEHLEVVDAPHKDTFVGPPLPTWHQPDTSTHAALDAPADPYAVGWSYQNDGRRDVLA